MPTVVCRVVCSIVPFFITAPYRSVFTVKQCFCVPFPTKASEGSFPFAMIHWRGTILPSACCHKYRPIAYLQEESPFFIQWFSCAGATIKTCVWMKAGGWVLVTKWLLHNSWTGVARASSSYLSTSQDNCKRLWHCLLELVVYFFMTVYFVTWCFCLTSAGISRHRHDYVRKPFQTFQDPFLLLTTSIPASIENFQVAWFVVG